ncbi:MAG: histidine phosphatase family protein, partial [Eubacterium sp.]
EAFASDLSRAYETGKIIAEPHGIIPVPDKALREISAGKWENEEFSKIEEIYGADFGVWQNDIMNARPTGGESVRELAKVRVTKEVWRLAALCDSKTVLVATHATPIRMLLREWVNIGVLRRPEVGQQRVGDDRGVRRRKAHGRGHKGLGEQLSLRRRDRPAAECLMYAERNGHGRMYDIGKNAVCLGS